MFQSHFIPIYNLRFPPACWVGWVLLAGETCLHFVVSNCWSMLVQNTLLSWSSSVKLAYLFSCLRDLSPSSAPLLWLRGAILALFLFSILLCCLSWCLFTIISLCFLTLSVGS